MPAAPSATIDSHGATSVGVASAVAGVSGLGVLLLAPRVLGGPDAPDTAAFITFWSLLFAMFGVLAGVQNETTRAVRAAESLPEDRPSPRTLPIALLIGASIAAVLAATSPAWSVALFGSYRPALVAAICLGVVVFAGHSAVAGALSGLARWETYSLLVGAEALGRLLLIAGAAALGWGLLGMQTAAAAGAAMWIVLVIFVPGARAGATARADVGRGQFLRQTGHSMIASASSATIVVGFPVALRLTTDASVYDASAALLLAVSLTRAPLLMPLNAYQGVAITHFLDHPEKGTSTLLRLSAIIVAVSGVGAGLAALVGPWLMRVILDAQVSSAVLAGLMAAAGALALVTLTGAAVLALGKHSAYSIGWFLASAVTIGLLLVPLSIEAKTILSLTCGPLVGVICHMATVTKTARVSR